MTKGSVALAILAVAAIAIGCDAYPNGAFGLSPVTLPASQMAFTVQPTTVQANQPITPAVVVAIQNANGQTVTNSSALVTMTLNPLPGVIGAVLSGTTTSTAVNGIATFNNLKVNQASGGYTLTASSNGLTPTSSSAFSVTP